MNKKTIIIFIIVACIATIIGITITYNNYKKEENVEKFEEYLIKNNFIKQKDGSYEKEVENDNNSIKYYYIKNTNLLTKEITVKSNETYSIRYEKQKIYGKYQLEGNINNQYIISIQKGTYDLKTKKYTCKIITDNKAEPKCNEIRKQILKYKKELDEINKNKIDVKYIN